MDLTDASRLCDVNGWQGDVRLTTSLTDADVPPPTVMLPHVMHVMHVMHGLGPVETGADAPNGITDRTVVLSSAHDFPSLAAAEAYAATEEHRQVRAMIASFRARAQETRGGPVATRPGRDRRPPERPRQPAGDRRAPTPRGPGWPRVTGQAVAPQPPVTREALPCTR
ncbi:hypothetical protein ACT4S5_16750 [Kocuria oceani]|uniref:hypothetical protein n=1 Tax=Kocuria oceani TaxID=988827 RepID=UPI0040370F4C